jgi:DNA (cytosine-5)-methyltransferase 1
MLDSLKILKLIRGQKTQREVADILGVDAKTVSRWENGHNVPPAMVGLALKNLIEADTLKVRPKTKKGTFTFIDLFAGIGGIRTAFEEMGGSCVFTSEWDSYAQTTYGANFGNDHPINGDITKVDAIDIPKHDVLLAGFPC